MGTRTYSGIMGVPVSYAMDGVQYIAVQSGWGTDGQSTQRVVNAYFDSEKVVPEGGGHLGLRAATGSPPGVCAVERRRLLVRRGWAAIGGCRRRLAGEESVR